MDKLGIYYFHQGTSNQAYDLLGAHYTPDVTSFCVWAPNALEVSVVGDFNNWDPKANPMQKINNEGLYQTSINNLKEFSCYQYAIKSRDGRLFFKSDPYAFHSELRPAYASKIFNLDKYVFNDEKWMEKRKKRQNYHSPLNIYELHLGSWRRYADGNFFSYKKLAKEVCEYVKKMGYTHIELLPLAEHPFDPSWGYQVTGYYAPTSRYGTPDELMYFVDYCHQNDIGVILDWVPSHFGKDAFGLIDFDGEPLYEPSSIYKKEHKEWGTRCFDYGRTEVQSFLVSNAHFWCRKYHFDGLRTDAVSSMLYLDFGRKDGEWQLNNQGNNLNLEAIAFIKKVNSSLKEYDSSLLLIAEESTTYPNITTPTSLGGLGYDYKWNMGWMNDTLKYISTDPLYRGSNLNLITFQLTYIFSEHYILALSHDEVVHLKKSLIEKMPGSYEQKFAGVKTYMTYVITHPGKKLSFMGMEFGQFREWNEARELDWSCLQYEQHQSLKKYIANLNHIYKKYSCLYNDTLEWNGFKWVVVNDQTNSVFAYYRCDRKNKLLTILNFAYVDHEKYNLEVENGVYKIIICSDDLEYSGKRKMKDYNYSVKNGKLIIDLPSNAGIILRKEE